MKLQILTLFLISLYFTSFSQNETNKTDKIDKLIEKKRSFNQKYGYGYKIQLYNGTEQNSRKLQARFRAEFPGYTTKLIYETPEWKVHVGNYKTKLEADRDLMIFEKKFSGIITIPMGK